MKGMKLRNLKDVFSEKPWAVLIILALIISAHSSLFQNQFVLDDAAVIHGWTLIQKITNLPRFFVNYIPPESQEGIYAPFRTLFLAVCRRMFGGLPLGYQITAMLIHLLGVVTVYRLSVLLTGAKRAPFIAALLFGLHPVHVAALSGITAGAETLGFVLMLMSFYFYVRGVKAAGGGFSGDQRKALLFFSMAVCTVEWALILPAAVIFYDIIFRDRKEWLKRAMPGWVAFIMIAGVYYLCKWLVLGKWAPGAYVFGRFDLSFFIGLKALVKYLWILIFPLGLAYNHILSPGISSFNLKDFDKQAVLAQSMGELQVILSLLVIIGLCVMAVRQYRRYPVITFALGWLVILLLPALQIIPSNIYFNERFLYGAVFGFCLLAGFAAERVWESGKTVSRALTALVLLCVVLFYGARTFLRYKDYAGPVVFFEKAVQANPQSAYLAGDLGVVYTRAQEYEKALQSFERAVALQPDNQHFYFSREFSYSMMERYDDSIATLKEAIALQPDFAEAYYNLAGIYRFLQRRDESHKSLLKALDAYIDQGRLLEAGAALGQMEQYKMLQEQVLKQVLDGIPALKESLPGAPDE